MFTKEIERPELIHSWGRYRTLKRFVNLGTICGNIKTMEKFTKQDFNDLNRLFRKLEKPAALTIDPERFSPLPGKEKAVVENATDGSTLTRVFSVIAFGVIWRDEILHKALVRGCSGDYVAISKAADQSTTWKKFSDEVKERFSEAIHLEPAEIEDFFDIKGLRENGDIYFTALIESHPDKDFVLETVQPGDPFEQRKMRVNGITLPGQNCVVTQVTHGGLWRKSDPAWRVPAFVKIQNNDPHE